MPKIQQWRPKCTIHLDPMEPVPCRLGEGYDTRYRAFKCAKCPHVSYHIIRSAELRRVIDESIKSKVRTAK